MSLDLDAYFARIGYTGPRVPTLAVLREICARQPQAIAFENLDVTAGGVPEIDLDTIAAKLLQARRGGYCYEQNTLLQAVLEALGFTVTGLAARVRFRMPADYVMARGHMTLLVECAEGRFLADSGFGGLTLTAPLVLRLDEPQQTPHETMRIVDAAGEYRVQAHIGGEWADLYQFDLAPHFNPDYVQQNWYTATRPQALFRHNVILTRPVPGGRYALFNQTLTFRPLGAAPQRRTVSGAAEMGQVFAEVFGLEVPAEIVAAAAEVAASGGVNPAFG